MSDLIHFLLTGLTPAFGQALLGGHASDVIVEDKLCGEYRQAVGSGATSMDCYVQATGVLFVANHLDVLQKSHQFGHTPAEFLRVRFHQNQLQNINDQKSTVFGAVFQLNRAGDQVAVICKRILD